MTTLPEKPACYGQKGRIKCTCGGDKDCIGRRYFWACAQDLAAISNPEERRRAFLDSARFVGKETGQQLYAAYRGLLTEEGRHA